MKNIYLSIGLILLTATASICQPPEAPPGISWMQIYGPEGHQDTTYSYFYDVFRTPEGYAMTGAIAMHNTVKAWLVVARENGEELFERGYDSPAGPASLFGQSLIQTEDGGYLIGLRLDEGDNGFGNFDMLRTDENGNQVWYRNICRYRPDLTGCFAVIELKAGTFCGAGYGRLGGGQFSRAFATLVDDNGENDPIWRYDYPVGYFRAVREVAEEGLLFAGFGSGRTLLKTNFNGETLRRIIYDGNGGLMDLVSHPAGGYAASGQLNESFGLLRVNHDGERIWEAEYPFDDELRSGGLSLAIMPDGGIVTGGSLILRDNSSVGAVVRTDANGNIRWRIRLDDLPEPWDEYTIHAIETVLVENDGSIILTGGVVHRDDRGNPIWEAFLLKLDADRSPPLFVEWSPRDLEFDVLQGDSVEFWVHVEDAQNDSIQYRWTVGEDTVATDSSVVVPFNELQDYNVQCWISDGGFADSIAWLVHVRDLFIAFYSPDTLSLALRRGITQTFSLDSVAAVEGDPVQYAWTLTNIDNFEREDAGGDTSATVEFLRSGNYQMEGLAYRGESSDNVIWTIQVRSAILDFWPRELSLSVFADSLVNFGVLPFNPESDSLSYRWELDGDSVGSDSTVGLRFAWDGQAEAPSYQVRAIVMDGAEGDTVTWNVTVREPDGVRVGESEKVGKWRLLSASPNPFNNSTTIRYLIHVAGRVNLTLHDLTGREVRECVSMDQSAGDYRFTLDGEGLTAGIYFLKLQTKVGDMAIKVLLVK